MPPRLGLQQSHCPLAHVILQTGSFAMILVNWWVYIVLLLCPGILDPWYSIVISSLHPLHLGLCPTLFTLTKKSNLLVGLESICFCTPACFLVPVGLLAQRGSLFPLPGLCLLAPPTTGLLFGFLFWDSLVSLVPVLLWALLPFGVNSRGDVESSLVWVLNVKYASECHLKRGFGHYSRIPILSSPVLSTISILSTFV